jgi:uncharacterized protein YggU (UPF0235/DUF167 family)
MDLRACARSGAILDIRVTPRARCPGILLDAEGRLRVAVSAPPEKGRATEAARRVLAQALGVAPTRLHLLRGAASRDKRFRLD